MGKAARRRRERLREDETTAVTEKGSQRPAARPRQLRARRPEPMVSLGGPALLVVLGLALYANSFSVPYLLDDQIEIVRNKEITEFKPLWQYFTQSRGVLLLSLAVNYHWGELRVWGYHLVNLIVHLVNGLLVYALVLGTLQLPFFAGRYIRHARSLALVTSLVFLAHPLQTVAVTYIIQRAESIASLFYLLTVVLFRYGATATSGRRRGWAYAGAGAATFLGILTKQITATIPFTVLLYQICFLSGVEAGTSRRGRWILYGFLFAALVSTLVMSWQYLLPTARTPGQLLPSIFIPTAGFGVEGVTPWQYLLTQFGVVTWYLRLYLWPSRLCFDYGWPLADSVWRLDVVLPFLLLLAIALAGVFAFRRYRLATFCIGWFFIILAPTSSLFPLRDAAFEHRMYLPIVGLSWLVVVGAYDAAGWLAQRQKIAERTVWQGLAAGAAAWIVMLGGLTIARNHIYQDPMRLAADSANKAPNHWRPEYEYGAALMGLGRKDEAIAAFQEAIRRDPKKGPPRLQLAQLYMERGLLDEAEGHLREAAQAGEQSIVGAAFRQLGFVYEARGQPRLALTYFQQAATLMPNWVTVHKRLAALYDETRDWRKAAAEYETIARLDPKSERAARQQAANAYYRAGRGEFYFGSREQAVELFEAAVRNDATHPLAHHYLAVAYTALGQWEKADTTIETAARVDPRNPIVIDNLKRIHNRERPQLPEKSRR